MSQVKRFDFTLKADIDFEKLVKIFDSNCSKWVFQKEKGETTDYLHFQGRFNLFKKLNVNSARTIWQSLLPGIHLSPTCNDVTQRDCFNYVLKDDTRVDGPWQDSVEIKVMTKQLKLFMEWTLYPWQKKVEDICKTWDMRHITVILDEIGHVGKSLFCEYLDHHDIATDVPPFTAMEDLMQCCMCMKAAKAYIIDMPKGMKKDKLASFYAGIECLKNGVMYDKRHHFKRRRIDRPQIIIFTNTKPDVSLLSKDRWNCFRITNDMDLVEVDLYA